jgi:two-component system chemotaxis response regulator CheB
MPESFTGAFADRLNSSCPMEIREAHDLDSVAPGTALVAPGDSHMVLERAGDSYHVRLKKGPLVHFQRPSVDVLFHSVATASGENAIGVLLTGMGCDGAKGLFAMRSGGGYTIAQDEKSCAIFGMPREAIRLGAADVVLPLKEIADAIVSKMSAGWSWSRECNSVTASQGNL